MTMLGDGRLGEAVKAYWAAHPDASLAECSRATGASSTYAGKLRGGKARPGGARTKAVPTRRNTTSRGAAPLEGSVLSVGEMSPPVQPVDRDLTPAEFLAQVMNNKAVPTSLQIAAGKALHTVQQAVGDVHLGRWDAMTAEEKRADVALLQEAVG